MSNCSKLKIKLEDSKLLEFFYAYDKNSATLDDLLEFIAFSFQNDNICPCYEFKAKYENKDILKLEKHWNFYECFNKYANFVLFIPDKQCKCDNNIKDNYKKSKLQIIYTKFNTKFRNKQQEKQYKSKCTNWSNRRQ